MNIVTVISLLACLLGAGMVMVIRKIRPAEVFPQAPAGWLNEFSIQRYQPMLRLVEEVNDSRGNIFQTGLTPKQADHYRTQRCHILRGYLQEIDRNFERMTKTFHALMDPESAQLAFTLRRCELSFASELNTARRQVAQYARGAGRLEFERLLAAFETLSRELRRLPPSAARAA